MSGTVPESVTSREGRPVAVSRRLRVVIIDAAADFALWHELNARPGYRVTILDCRETTRAKLRDARPDVVVLDWSVGHDPSGWPLLHALSIDTGLQRVPVVICTEGNVEIRHRSDDDESVRILPKPFGLDALVDVIAGLVSDVEAAAPMRPDGG